MLSHLEVTRNYKLHEQAPKSTFIVSLELILLKSMAKGIINYTYTFRNSFIICILYAFILASTPIVAQVKSVGLPLINNFPRTTYNASTQNWDIVQNKLGFIYFANNDGLLEFDGQHWKTFPMPNKSIVRSVIAIGDTIYVGAFEDFGYFAPDKEGSLIYTSLLHLVPEGYRSFDEIWNIHKTPQGIIFQSFKFLFNYDNNTVKVIEPKGTYGHSFTVGNGFFYVDDPSGLYNFNFNGSQKLLNNPLFESNELRSILPFGKGRFLLGFINEGLYVLEGDKLTKWNSDVNKEILQSSIFSAIRLSSGNFAFGTIQNGIYISDEQGNVLQHLNRFKGLQNNTVLSLYEDKTGNLWLGLDNGIDYIEINSPLSIFDHTYHIESTYASIVFGDILYVGTNQGLFYMPLKEINKKEAIHNSFKFIEGTEGQVWKLEIVNNTLLCGHNFGLFQVTGDQARKVTSERGYWSFIAQGIPNDTLICGTYNGLSVMVLEGSNWKFSHLIAGFSESCKSFVLNTNQDEIWMAHGYRGLYHLRLSKDLKSVIEYKLYSGTNGLPKELPYSVFKLRDETVFASKSGLYTFNNDLKQFEPFTKNKEIFGEKMNVNIDQIETDVNGNIWYFSSGRMGLLRLLEDGSYSNVTAPFMRINFSLIQAFESVFVYDNRNVFIGTKNGLIHYDPFYRKDYYKSQPLVLRDIIFSGVGKSIKIGNLTVKDAENDPVRSGDIRIPFSLNDVMIRFSNPEFEGAGSCLFSFRLDGIESTWSDWSQQTFKEYMNLPEGDYLFELKARSFNNSEEKYSRFNFTVQPPFYRSVVAYILYVIILIAVVIGNVFFIQRRVSLTKQQEKEKHSKALRDQELSFREHALLAEKEIINLKNESLQSQVSHKNKELANTTLHLIHKNKILNAIKTQLNGLLDNALAQSKKNQIENLVLKINKELKNEKFKQVFDEYFDDVHQDFIARLKDKHPDLSPRELRLCAYLKMNLSTKEIAPLMNISVRGVEIGRYRLRKKLELERDDNLIDYLLKF